MQFRLHKKRTKILKFKEINLKKINYYGRGKLRDTYAGNKEQSETFAYDAKIF